MDKVYAIFSGEYSDWNVHGYFFDEDEANRYCALKNNGDSGYYVSEIERIVADVPKQPIWTKYAVHFNLYGDIYRVWESGKYLGDIRPVEAKISYYTKGTQFDVTANDKEQARKIALDCNAKLKLYVEEEKEANETNGQRALSNAIDRFNGKSDGE